MTPFTDAELTDLVERAEAAVSGGDYGFAEEVLRFAAEVRHLRRQLERIAFGGCAAGHAANIAGAALRGLEA